MTDEQWAGWCSIFERNFLSHPAARIVGREVSAASVVYALQLGERVVERTFPRPLGFAAIPNPLESARAALRELEQAALEPRSAESATP